MRRSLRVCPISNRSGGHNWGVIAEQSNIQRLNDAFHCLSLSYRPNHFSWLRTIDFTLVRVRAFRAAFLASARSFIPAVACVCREAR
jgi:hypothetical protein